jgi:hypothetical protein
LQIKPLFLKFNLTDDETIEEEIVSDGELPHKKSKKTVSSPTSPTNPDRQFSPNNHDDVMIPQNGNSTNTSAMQAEPPSSGNKYII